MILIAFLSFASFCFSNEVEKINEIIDVVNDLKEVQKNFSKKLNDLNIPISNSNGFDNDPRLFQYGKFLEYFGKDGLVCMEFVNDLIEKDVCMAIFQVDVKMIQEGCFGISLNGGGFEEERVRCLSNQKLKTTIKLFNFIAQENRDVSFLKFCIKGEENIKIELLIKYTLNSLNKLTEFNYLTLKTKEELLNDALEQKRKRQVFDPTPLGLTPTDTSFANQLAAGASSPSIFGPTTECLINPLYRKTFLDLITLASVSTKIPVNQIDIFNFEKQTFVEGQMATYLKEMFVMTILCEFNNFSRNINNVIEWIKKSFYKIGANIPAQHAAMKLACPDTKWQQLFDALPELNNCGNLPPPANNDFAFP